MGERLKGADKTVSRPRRLVFRSFPLAGGRLGWGLKYSSDKNGPSLFVSDYSDYPALLYAVSKLYPQGLGAELVYWDNQDLQQQIKDHIHDKNLYVVTASPQQANAVLQRFGLGAGSLKKVRRAGFFNIYAVNCADCELRWFRLQAVTPTAPVNGVQDQPSNARKTQ
ncbi:MAG: hypothetical protein ACYC2E_03110 [Sulfuricella sp.]